LYRLNESERGNARAGKKWRNTDMLGAQGKIVAKNRDILAVGNKGTRVPTAGASTVNPNPPIRTIARSNFHILLESNNEAPRRWKSAAGYHADRSRAAHITCADIISPPIYHISARARERASERASERPRRSARSAPGRSR